MSRTLRVLVGLVLLALVAGLVGGFLWVRSVGDEIRAGKAQLRAAGLPLSVADLEAEYTLALGPDRADPLPLDGLVEAGLRLDESGLPLHFADAGSLPEPDAAAREVLEQHGGLVDRLRAALQAPGRRVDLDLDPLGEVTDLQVGFRVLVQLARWEFARRIVDGESTDRVVEAGRLVLSCAEVYAYLPHTLAQMERVSWCDEVWRGVRPALEARPAEAADLFARLGPEPVRGAARRALLPQSVLVVSVEEEFEAAASGALKSRFGDLPGGEFGWYWMRRGIPPLLDDLLEAHAGLAADDLDALRALAREIQDEARTHGTLYGLLAFSPAHLLEAEIGQRHAWAVSKAGAEALVRRAATGAWPEDRPAGEGRPALRSDGEALVLELGERDWRIEPPL